MDRYPGLAPGSPVLSKALLEPALKRARAGNVAAATALAQVVFSAGNYGQALAIVDMLEASGASASDIYPVLSDRATRAKTSDAAAGLAASFAAWHDHPAEASRWYDEIVARASKDNSARAKNLKRWAKVRADEAARLAEFQRPPCTVEAQGVSVASKVKAVPAFSAAGSEGGVLVAWIEGAAAPAQSLKVAHVSADGTASPPITVTEHLPAAKKVAGDVLAAYAPKNREPALSLVRCGDTIEVAARCAPNCAWARSTLSDSGQVTTKVTTVGTVGKNGRLPSEDVWWNTACSNDRLMHIWLADTQLLRAAWFEKGVALGDPSNLRVPGFSPWFVATGAPEGATRLLWIDIMGQGRSQILSVVIPEDREVPLGEDETNAAGQPVVQSIDGRVEHMRLTPVGERLALTYHPKHGDIMVRWMEQKSKKLLGSERSIARLREDANKVRFDAAAVGDRLGLAWIELQTGDAATLYFQTVGADGNSPSRPQRVAGLVRPDLSPALVPVGDRWAIVYADRSDEGGEALDVAILRCGN